jgi:hypothetical protein
VLISAQLLQPAQYASKVGMSCPPRGSGGGEPGCYRTTLNVPHGAGLVDCMSKLAVDLIHITVRPFPEEHRHRTETCNLVKSVWKP